MSLFSHLKNLAAGRRGAMITIAAILLPAIMLATAGTVEMTHAMRMRSDMQRTLDSAALTAAREFYAVADKEKAKGRAKKILESAKNGKDKRLNITDVQFNLEKDDDKITAVSKAVLTMKMPLLGMFHRGEIDMTVESRTSLGIQKDVYINLMVDATGSMHSLLKGVQDAAVTFEDDVRQGLADRGYFVGDIYVKVAYFRDMRITESYTAWNESPVYNLSKGSDQAAFQTFVRSEVAVAGGDIPESSISAIAYMLTADLPAELDPTRTAQTMVLWTHVNGIPLSSQDVLSSKISDDYPYWYYFIARPDISVATWKLRGPLSNDRWYRITPLYNPYKNEGWVSDLWSGVTRNLGVDTATGIVNGTVNLSDYEEVREGCCNSLAHLRDTWENGGTVPMKSRHLALFVNTDGYPWQEMTSWPNVMVKPYENPSDTVVIKNIIEAILKNADALRVNS